jgi:hypothetical protein
VIEREGTAEQTEWQDERSLMSAAVAAALAALLLVVLPDPLPPSGAFASFPHHDYITQLICRGLRV